MSRARPPSCFAINPTTSWTTRNRPRSRKTALHRVSANKVSNACEHDAAAVIFCRTRLKSAAAAARTIRCCRSMRRHDVHHPDVPVIAFRRAVIDGILHDLDEPELGGSKIGSITRSSRQPRVERLAQCQGDASTCGTFALRVKNCRRHLPGEGRWPARPLCWAPITTTSGTVPQACWLQARDNLHGADDNASRWPWCWKLPGPWPGAPQKLHRLGSIHFFQRAEEWGFWAAATSERSACAHEHDRRHDNLDWSGGSARRR